MKLDHIAMYVKDLEGAREFFTKYFNATSNEMYHNKTTGLQTYFLSFEGGSRLEIMKRPEMVDPEKDLMRTGFIHIAFGLGSEEKVDELTKRLKEDGYEILSGPRVTGDGYYRNDEMGRTINTKE